MKNASPGELRALRERALRLQLSSRAELDAAVRRVMRQNRIVGLSLVLCHPDGRDETLCFGRARLSPDVSVTPETCFRTASVSKLVMAFGALALAQRMACWSPMRISACCWATPSAARTPRIRPSPCACCSPICLLYTSPSPRDS